MPSPASTYRGSCIPGSRNSKARKRSEMPLPDVMPDGTMPEGISDLELVRVPTRIEEGDAKTETMSDETAERMARTRFIVDEYTMGVLDEQEAGERLFRHLFPHWG